MCQSVNFRSNEVRLGVINDVISEKIEEYEKWFSDIVAQLENDLISGQYNPFDEWCGPFGSLRGCIRGDIDFAKRQYWRLINFDELIWDPNDISNPNSRFSPKYNIDEIIKPYNQLRSKITKATNIYKKKFAMLQSD